MNQLKRPIDLALSAFGLTLFSPLMLCIAIAIKLDSPGPVFFRQERVGLEGRPFRIHKFRTMRHAIGGPALSMQGDSRVTRVGEVLRKWKLDELPQFIDVVNGHMSIIGPRPELARYVALWPAADRELILSVRPGVSDPASIEFRHEAQLLARATDAERFYVEEILPRKATLYADYVRNRSVRGDFALIFRTLRSVVGT